MARVAIFPQSWNLKVASVNKTQSHKKDLYGFELYHTCQIRPFEVIVKTPLTLWEV